MKLLRNAVLIGIVAVLSAGSVLADQGNMDAAIAHLREARAALERAVPNKGGHRERALSQVDAAIRECKAGIVWARNHR